MERVRQQDAAASMPREAVMSITKLYTAEDLAAMGSDAPFELIEGELIEVAPSQGFSSEVSLLVAMPLLAFVRSLGLGHVTGESGGYVLSRDPDTVVAPDIGFISTAKVPDGLRDLSFIPFPPDLAIEIMSRTDRYPATERKARRYLEAGTRLVWVLRPDYRTAVVFAADQPPRQLSILDELDGGDVLPGFRLPLTDVFT